MKQTILVCCAALVLAGTGTLHGVLTNRWGAPGELQAAAAAVESTPLSYGAWRGTAYEVGPQVLQIAGAAGSAGRHFTHDKQGTVSMLLLCGPPGPMSVHPPTVCMLGQGYRLVSEPQRISFDAGEDGTYEFWVADFFKDLPTRSVNRVYWAWTADGTWLAPDNSRREFAGTARLYKLYVSSNRTSQDDEFGDDACGAFIRDAIPQLSQALN